MISIENNEISNVKKLERVREKLVKLTQHKLTVNIAMIQEDIKNIDILIDLFNHGTIQIMIEESKRKAIEKHGQLKNTDEFIGALIQEVKEVLQEISLFQQSYAKLENLKSENKLKEMNKESFDMIQSSIQAIKELCDTIAILNKFEDYYNNQDNGGY